jgi:hypothetical protein
MPRLVLIVLSLVIAAAGYAMLTGERAEAQPAFKKEFDNKYLSDKNKDSALYKAWEGKSTCNTCHIGNAEEREHRNEYGKALSKYIKKEDADALSFKNRMKDPANAKKVEKKIRDALDKVEKEHSDSKDKSSPTFGDLIKTGKLPVSPTTLDEK